MPALHALGVYDTGDIQYFGKITAISKPVSDDDGNVTYTVTSQMFGDDTVCTDSESFRRGSAILDVTE